MATTTASIDAPDILQLPQAPPLTEAIDLKAPQYYFNRELSWLEFNRRVLEATLLFIVCNNMDDVLLLVRIRISN